MVVSLTSLINLLYITDLFKCDTKELITLSLTSVKLCLNIAMEKLRNGLLKKNLYYIAVVMMCNRNKLIIVFQLHFNDSLLSLQDM